WAPSGGQERAARGRSPASCAGEGRSGNSPSRHPAEMSSEKRAMRMVFASPSSLDELRARRPLLQLSSLRTQYPPTTPSSPMVMTSSWHSKPLGQSQVGAEESPEAEQRQLQ